MSSYTIEIAGVGPVKVTKKRGMRSLRLRINPKGEVAVSAPWTVPKGYVEQFIADRRDWIIKNNSSPQAPLMSGVYFGASSKLIIRERHSRNYTVADGRNLIVHLAGEFDPSDRKQQDYIEKKVIAAMQTEAENVLLPRLEQLAIQTGHEFNQAYVKRLTSRWGSCDSQKNIILNVFLLQLPEKLRDYVILHELTHTKYMDHSTGFWRHMEELMPSVRLYRKLLKQYQPRIETRQKPYLS